MIGKYLPVTTYPTHCNNKYLLLQRFSVIVTTNIWMLHCYNLFILLQRLFVVTILLQQINVVTILLHRIACNCYNLFDKPCNNGIFWLLQALEMATSDRHSCASMRQEGKKEEWPIHWDRRVQVWRRGEFLSWWCRCTAPCPGEPAYFDDDDDAFVVVIMVIMVRMVRMMMWL